jgi:hypothetical protein
MQHSSRRNPCPVCNRNKDDKCRWSNTRIYCYVGDSFAPPRNLQLGDRIKIAGELWKLFSYQSGFAGTSYAFAIYDGESYKFLNYEDKRSFRKNCIRLSRLFLQMQKSVIADWLKIKSEDSFHLMSIDAFRENKGKINSILSRLDDLCDFAFTNKRYLTDTGINVDKVKKMKKELSETLSTSDEHELLYFGQIESPTALEASF